MGGRIIFLSGVILGAFLLLLVGFHIKLETYSMKDDIYLLASTSNKNNGAHDISVVANTDISKAKEVEHDSNNNNKKKEDEVREHNSTTEIMSKNIEMEMMETKGAE